MHQRGPASSIYITTALSSLTIRANFQTVSARSKTFEGEGRHVPAIVETSLLEHLGNSLDFSSRVKDMIIEYNTYQWTSSVGKPTLSGT